LKAVQYLHKDGETTKQEKALFTNVYQSDSVVVDPPVQKVISGDTPSTSGTFVFYLKADDNAFPMPSGSTGGTAVLSITGAGTKDFGNITFTQTGTYTYAVYERKGSLGGYKYDSTIYTMKIVVTRDSGGNLVATRTITNAAGTVQSGLTFVNEYDESTDPKTGDSSLRSLWWILLLVAGAGVGAALYIRKKQKKR
jgi:pilin isopeptide linkage protein